MAKSGRKPKLKNDPNIHMILDDIEGILGKKNGALLIGIVMDSLLNFMKKTQSETIDTVEVKFDETSLVFDCATNQYVQEGEDA